MIPRRGRDELLQLLMINAEPGRHRLHRVALAVRQPTHVELTQVGAAAAGSVAEAAEFSQPRR
jgi:hypothetical protein